MRQPKQKRPLSQGWIEVNALEPRRSIESDGGLAGDCKGAMLKLQHVPGVEDSRFSRNFFDKNRGMPAFCLRGVDRFEQIRRAHSIFEQTLLHPLNLRCGNVFWKISGRPIKIHSKSYLEEPSGQHHHVADFENNHNSLSTTYEFT